MFLFEFGDCSAETQSRLISLRRYTYNFIVFRSFIATQRSLNKRQYFRHRSSAPSLSSARHPPSHIRIFPSPHTVVCLACAVDICEKCECGYIKDRLAYFVHTAERKNFIPTDRNGREKSKKKENCVLLMY